jgi:hypothetical protein
MPWLAAALVSRAAASRDAEANDPAAREWLAGLLGRLAAARSWRLPNLLRSGDVAAVLGPIAARAFVRSLLQRANATPYSGVADEETLCGVIAAIEWGAQ